MPGEKFTVAASGGAHVGRIAFANSDLSGGVASWGNWLVVLDGAILNADEVSQGEYLDHTAIVGRLLAETDPIAGLRKLQGDFAGAAYDRGNDRFFLFRDRLGIKPLYWTKTEGAIACASQPRALLGQPGVSREPNWSFVARFAGSHYRTFDNLPTESPFANVFQVPAGTCIQIDRGKIGEPRRYWHLEEIVGRRWIGERRRRAISGAFA